MLLARHESVRYKRRLEVRMAMATLVSTPSKASYKCVHVNVGRVNKVGQRARDSGRVQTGCYTGLYARQGVPHMCARECSKLCGVR